MPRGGLCCLKSQALSYQKIPPLEWKPHCDPVPAQRRPRVGVPDQRSRLGSAVFERDPPAGYQTCQTGPSLPFDPGLQEQRGLAHLKA